MKPIFDTTMRAATDATRAGNLSEATRLIQSALSGAGTAPVSPPAAIDERKIDKSAEVLEPEVEEPTQSRTHYPLGDVVRALRQGRSRHMPTPRPGARAEPEPAIPDGAQFLARTGAEGRAYRLYVPAAAPRGVIIMLHGCQQNPDDFALGTGMNAAAEDSGFIVVYPLQPQSANVSKCWNWFDPKHQRRGTGEPESIARLTRDLLDEFDLEDAFIAGLSAGGAMAAVIAEAYPDLFNAVGVHSGLAPGSATDVASAFAAMRGDARRVAASPNAVPLIVFQGSSDTVVHPSNADALLRARGIDVPNTNSTRTTIGGRNTLTSTFDQGRVELWRIENAGHAWSGGQPAGSYTDAAGPDASAEMVRFFKMHAKAEQMTVR